MRYIIKTGVLVIAYVILFTGCSSSPELVTTKESLNKPVFTNREAGAKVLIVVNDGREYEGELLRVRDSTMILCKKYEADEEKLTDLVYPFYLIKNKNINSIVLVGDSFTGFAVIIGGVLGSFSGAMIGSSYGRTGGFIDFGDADKGCIIGGVAGVILGIFAGESGREDIVLVEYADEETYDFNQFNAYARYGKSEPEYLKEIK